MEIKIGIQHVNREIVVESPSHPRPLARIDGAGSTSGGETTVETACGKVFELAVPFRRLDLEAGDPIRFYVELLDGDTSLDRAPREGIFELTVPSPDFERIMWQA